jgi:hypothetical protein
MRPSVRIGCKCAARTVLVNVDVLAITSLAPEMRSSFERTHATAAATRSPQEKTMLRQSFIVVFALMAAFQTSRAARAQDASGLPPPSTRAPIDLTTLSEEAADKAARTTTVEGSVTKKGNSYHLHLLGDSVVLNQVRIFTLVPANDDVKTLLDASISDKFISVSGKLLAKTRIEVNVVGKGLPIVPLTASPALASADGVVVSSHHPAATPSGSGERSTVDNHEARGEHPLREKLLRFALDRLVDQPRTERESSSVAVGPATPSAARVVDKSGIGNVARKGGSFAITRVIQGAEFSEVYTVSAPSAQQKSVLEKAIAQRMVVNFSGYVRVPSSPDRLVLDSIKIFYDDVPLMMSSASASVVDENSNEARSILGTVIELGGKLIFEQLLTYKRFRLTAMGDAQTTLEKSAGTGEDVSITGSIKGIQIKVETASLVTGKPLTDPITATPGLVHALDRP